MNEKALRILEYPKVIAKLTEFADSAPGKGLCESLVPMDDLSAIVSAQNETEDATSYIIRLGKIFTSQQRRNAPEKYTNTVPKSMKRTKTRPSLLILRG